MGMIRPTHPPHPVDVFIRKEKFKGNAVRVKPKGESCKQLPNKTNTSQTGYTTDSDMKSPTV